IRFKSVATFLAIASPCRAGKTQVRGFQVSWQQERSGREAFIGDYGLGHERPQLCGSPAGSVQDSWAAWKQVYRQGRRPSKSSHCQDELVRITKAAEASSRPGPAL